MNSNSSDSLSERGHSLEEEFFRREDQRLIERLRALQAAETARDALSKASGITNTAVLDKLLELKIKAETVAALAVAPLVEVAWADGTLDAKERAAVMEHARESGFKPGSIELALLEAWLERRPEASLLTAWTHMVQGLCEELAPPEVAKLRSSLLDRARAVAGASGGVMGLGSKVSKPEAAMLAKLEKAFDRAG